MIGNAKGWTLAGLIFAIEVACVGYALSLDRVSSPTALVTSEAALDPITLPVDPRTVLTPYQPGEAGPLYCDAADRYLANVSLYENFIRDRDRAQIEKLIAVDKVVAATDLAGGVIYADRPEAAVVYGESTNIQALQQVGIAAIDVGLIFEKRDPARARTYYEAAFSLGMRMFDERLTYRELAAGVQLMSTSGACLAAQAKKAGRADDESVITHFTDAQREYVKSKVMPTFEAIYTFNELEIGPHAGDVFAFATDSRERMWRVEATLKLGRMRYNAGNPGRTSDQRHAERLVTQMAASEGDVVVRHAARLARDLTVENFRVLR